MLVMQPMRVHTHQSITPKPSKRRASQESWSQERTVTKVREMRTWERSSNGTGKRTKECPEKSTTLEQSLFWRNAFSKETPSPEASRRQQPRKHSWSFPPEQAEHKTSQLGLQEAQTSHGQNYPPHSPEENYIRRVSFQYLSFTFVTVVLLEILVP